MANVADSAGDYKQAMFSALFTDKADQKRMDEFIRMDPRGAIQEMWSRCEATEKSDSVVRNMTEAVNQQKVKSQAAGSAMESRAKEMVEFMTPLVCLAAIAMSRPGESI